ncbi:MAG: PAS domain S-box protein, partial [Chloroflexota bacterium]
MTALQNVLRPPHLDENPDGYLASLIHYVLLVCMAITATTTIAAFFLTGYTLPRALPGMVIIAGQGITLYVLHRGRVQAAAWTAISVTWTVIVVAAAFTGGIESYLLMSLNVVLVIAALVADRAGNRAVLVGNVIVISTFFIVEQVGITIPPLIGRLDNVNWLTALGSTVATGALLSVTLRRLHDAMRTTHQQKIELQQTLRDLEHSTVSGAYFDSILNSMLEMILVVDDSQTIIKANTPATETLGYPEKTLVGMSLRDVLGEDTPDVLLSVDRLIEDEHATFHVRTHYRTHDGCTVHVDFSASRLKSERRRIVCVAHNVTEQVQTETALKISARRLQTAINGINVILFALDTDGNFIFAEGQGMEPLGFSPAQLVGQNIYNLYENEPDTTIDLQRALRGEQFHAIASARGHTFDTHYNPAFDDHGNLIGTVGFSINITDRVYAEKAYIREHSLMRTLVDNLPAIVWAKDLEGRFMLSNPAHVRHCGMEAETDILDKTAVDLMHSSAAFNDAERLAISSRQALTRIETATGANGDTIWMQTTYMPLIQQHELVGILGVSTDISQRKRDEETIRESEERIQAVIASAAVYIFAIDRDYNLTFFEGRGVEEQKLEQVGRALGQSLFIPVENGLDLQIAD